MKSIRVITGVFVLVSIAVAPRALGLANRVFVSARSGNNANACDNITTPCQTLQGAVSQLNPGGEAIVLDTGGYGPVSITQSVTIEAASGVTGFIHPPSGDAITVNAPGATVVVRGLTIDGAGATTGSGIKVVAVSVLHVESCVIAGFAAVAIPDGNGIYFTSAGQLFVKDTIIRGNGQFGIRLSPSAGTALASVEKCRLEHNRWGLASGVNAKAAIRDSVASGNTARGLYATGGEIDAEGVLVAYNNTGLHVDSFGTLRASNCTVTGNALGIGGGAVGDTLLSRSNNTVEGNTADNPFFGTYSAK